ncbi:MAG: helix-turn-helix domain-containing protein [Comamonadaceae bacterium]|nr:helix-turn-helix domain-containing protein [Comamonadaceae bacterium]
MHDGDGARPAGASPRGWASPTATCAASSRPRMACAPRDYLTTQRLLLAKQLLTDTALPVTQVALASGFASLRRFNAAFAERYRLSPTRCGAQGAAPAPRERARAAPGLPAAVRRRRRCSASSRARAAAGVEQVDGLRRCAARWRWTHRGAARWPAGSTARFVPERHEVHLQRRAGLLPVLGAVLQRVRQALRPGRRPGADRPRAGRAAGAAAPGVRAARRASTASRSPCA